MSESLKKNKDFQNIYRKGRSFANRYLVMYVIVNGLEKNRVGISVSKKVGNSVVRHRLTRLIRESYRLNDQYLKTGYDIVVIARAASRGKKYIDISNAYMHLADLHSITSKKKYIKK